MAPALVPASQRSERDHHLARHHRASVPDAVVPVADGAILIVCCLNSTYRSDGKTFEGHSKYEMSTSLERLNYLNTRDYLDEGHGTTRLHLCRSPRLIGVFSS